MKRFLYVDDSGRGFSAEWADDEIIADIARGDAGTFAEYDAVQTDDDGDPLDVERLSEWLDRCDAGQEFELDAAHLVCIEDECTGRIKRHETPARFTLTIATENECFDSDVSRAVADCLRDVATRLDGLACRCGVVRDANGNTVGRFEFD
jgi:hypothetical protein